MWLYGFGKALCAAVYRTAFRFRIEGREHIPLDGGVIICANHVSLHDPVIVGVAAPRKISFMAKEQLFKIPVLSFFARAVGAFPVKRGQPDRAALKRSIELLTAGGCFGIFPEGTRIRTGKLGKPEPGTAYLAIKSGAVVIPTGITSTYRLFRPVVIKFGPPVNLDAYRTGKVSGEALERAAVAIMNAIGELLEPPQRNEAEDAVKEVL